MELSQNHLVNVTTGSSETNSSEGSDSDKIIYTVVKNVSSFSSILASAEGCIWNIEFSDNSIIQANIPLSYSGSGTCYYNSTGFGVSNENDALQIAVLNLLKELDTDSDNKIDVLFSEQDLEITTNQIVGIPFAWSTEVQVRVWRW